MSYPPFVKITDGIYLNETINGVFPLIKPWKQAPTTAFVQVSLPHKPHGARVKVTPEQLEYQDADGNPVELQNTIVTARRSTTGTAEIPFHGIGEAERSYRETETEEEAMDRIKRDFEIVEEMTRSSAEGNLKGLIISGPAGIGKSYGVERTLEEGGMLRKFQNKQENYEIVKGYMRPLSLYKALYSNRGKDDVIVFDDCDIVLNDDTSLNLLKAAMDTGKKRILGWGSETSALAEEDVPRKFEFQGSIIFITNINFDEPRSKRLEPHLKAIKSRCMYLNLEITTTDDMLLRIKQTLRDGLLRKHNLDMAIQDEIFAFMAEHVDHLNELSLRTVLKMADIRKARGNNWEEYTVRLVMKREAKYKWLSQRRDDRIAGEEDEQQEMVFT